MKEYLANLVTAVRDFTDMIDKGEVLEGAFYNEHFVADDVIEYGDYTVKYYEDRVVIKRGDVLIIESEPHDDTLAYYSHPGYLFDKLVEGLEKMGYEPDKVQDIEDAEEIISKL